MVADYVERRNIQGVNALNSPGMAAVILAAGRGSRLGWLWPPKQLLSYGPHSILAHIIKTLGESGVLGNYYLVVNPWNRDYILDEARKAGCHSCQAIVLWRYWEENGVSMIIGLKAALVNNDMVILSMSDHIYPARLVNKVVSMLETSECPIVMAVDGEPELVELSEATKVLVRNGSVERVSKRLSEYNYVDAGVFGFTREALNVLIEAYKMGLRLISDMITYAVRYINVCPADVTGIPWVDVDTLDDAIKARDIRW